MDEAALIKFGKWIDYGKSHPKGKKFPRKGHGLGHVIVFGMKLRSLNFANASTMANVTSGVKMVFLYAFCHLFNKRILDCIVVFLLTLKLHLK